MSTSGILVIARNSRAASFLGKEFIGRTVVKRYVAWVYGRMENTDGEIDLPIGTSREMSPLHFVDHEHGKEARTIYHTAAVLDDRSLVILKPMTGRSHQLRLHLYSISHPILGDAWYENGKNTAMASHLQLHAFYLKFRHPSGKTMEFLTCPPFDCPCSLVDYRA